MTAPRHILRFAIGPVQSFVQQARRTRDLWAGSFILSWLSAHAMVAVRKAGGIIMVPQVADAHGNATDPFVARIETHKNGDGPEIGTLPNQFKAEVPAEFNPDVCVQAVTGAWKKLTDRVWDKLIKDAIVGLGCQDKGRTPKEIWDLQVAGFWETYWVMGPEDDNSGRWLDQRKLWRNHVIPAQPACDPCTLMEHWRELSGARDKTIWDNFWNALRSSMGGLDLGETERLCAIALVKRLFPRLKPDDLNGTIGWVPGGARIGRWPSTGHVAAAPWLAAHKDTDAGKAYAKHVVDKLDGRHRGERNSRIKCLEGAGDESLAAVDANLFHADDVMNEYATPLHARAGVGAANLRTDLAQALKALTDKVGKPESYFAVLVLDGDRIGKLIDDNPGKEADIGAAMQAFSTAARQIVRDANGVVVYAGGDDALAMFPATEAIAAAEKLAAAFAAAFAKKGLAATASAAIVFADHHEPLRGVLAEAQRLLAEVAKADNARNSLAVAVVKPSGSSAEWVAKWKKTGLAGAVVKPPEVLRALAAGMQGEDGFSSGAVYNFRRRFVAPAGGTLQGLELTKEELTALLARQIGRDLSARQTDEAKARRQELARNMMLVGRPRVVAIEKGAGADIDMNALLLVRFLATHAQPAAATPSTTPSSAAPPPTEAKS